MGRKKIYGDRTNTSFRVPKDLLKNLKKRCIDEEITLQEYLLNLVQKDMDRWKKKQEST